MVSLNLKRQPLALKNENVRNDMVSKREKEKLQKVSHTFNQLGWEVFDFTNRLELCCESSHPRKEIIVSIVALEKITFIFGAKQ
jgi:hypothetical protein